MIERVVARAFVKWSSYNTTPHQREEPTMNKTMTQMCLLSLIAVGFVACTEDPADNNSTSAGTDMATTPVDMGPATDMPVTTPDTPIDTPDTTPDTPDAAPDMDEPAVGGNCTSATPPERCAADPATFSDWAPASVISRLELMDDTCCYDYTGDDVINNSLGKTLSQLGATLGFSIEDANGAIGSAIADGSIALVLEHQGVDLAGGPFSINFLLGEQDGDFTAPLEAGGNKYKISPTSFEAGVWPQARIADASLTGTQVEGGPGVVAIVLNFLGVQLTLRIVAAQVEATVDNADAGVKLSSGKLGGLIRADDLVGALNDFADTNCGCFMIEAEEEGGEIDPFLKGNLVEGYECADLGKSTCDENADGPEGICAQISGACSLIPSVLPTLTDVNSTDVGNSCEAQVDCDSISVGFTFDAFGAEITGVAPAE
jgi:hypothetical protein